MAVPAINNIEQARLDSDLGRFANGRPKEKTAYNRNAFKTPSLRNVALTAPYMHNGSVANLWETLQKPEQRQTRFWVGNRNFDPVSTPLGI